MRRVFFTLLLILIPACGGSDHSSPAPPLPLSPAPAAPSAAPSSPLSASPPVSQGAARCTNPAPRSPYLAFVTRDLRDGRMALRTRGDGQVGFWRKPGRKPSR